MNCQHCNKHMYNYYDGELSSQLKLEIDNHLAACPSCRFQYALTLKENQVLRDISDIPEISHDFNKQVMNSITPEKLPTLPDNVLVMSKDKRLHFRWSSLYTKSAIAVLLLALGFYVPGIITSDQNHQQLAQNNNAAKLELNSSKDEVAITGGIAKQESLPKQNIIKQDGVKSSSSTLGSTQNRNADSQTNTFHLNIATNPQLYVSSRMAFDEAGRSDRKEINPDTLSVSSLNLKNIPEKYTLVNKVNSIENQIEYSYQTDDGAETINIQLITSPSQDKTIIPVASSEKVSETMMSLAAPAVTENVNREILVGDQKISIQVSGNISSDELNSLANNIVISKAP